MNQWIMVPKNSIITKRMLIFQRADSYQYNFYCYTPSDGKGKFGLRSPDPQIIDFLSLFDKSIYILNSEWEPFASTGPHSSDVVHAFSTDDKDLAVLFKITWC